MPVSKKPAVLLKESGAQDFAHRCLADGLGSSIGSTLKDLRGGFVLAARVLLFRRYRLEQVLQKNLFGLPPPAKNVRHLSLPQNEDVDLNLLLL